MNELEFPENLIDELIELILLNSGFAIAIEEEENIKMKYPGIKDLLTRINILKSEAYTNIKYNYIKNNSFFYVLRQNADIISQEIIGLFPITKKIKDIICERIQNNTSKIKNNDDLGKIVVDIKNLKKEEKDKPKNFNIFSIALKVLEYYEYFDCFIRIPVQFKELNNIFKEEEFNKIKTKLDEIQKNFNSHNKMVKLTNDPQIDLKNLDEKIKNLKNDFNQLKELITEIDNNLSALYENRNRDIISSIFNGIFVGLNIALMIAGKPSFSNFYNIGVRGINMACNINSIVKCQSFINKYKKLLERAENQRNEIINCIKDCEKEIIEYYKKNKSNYLGEKIW